MKILGGVDIDVDSADTYRLNFSDAGFALADIRTLTTEQVRSYFELNSVDRLVFAGCAPCQPFSKQRTTKSSRDDRIPLLAQFGRHVEAFLPDAILVENVPGIQRFERGAGPLADFLKRIEELGYQHDTRTIDARAFGVPQRRSRLVVLASRHGSPGFPQPTHGPRAQPYSTVRDWIKDMPAISAGECHTTVPNHRAAALSPRNLERIRATPEGGDRRNWPSELLLDCHSGGYAGHTDVYGRMKWDSPAPCLTTRCVSYSNGRFGHPEQDRAISIREAASLQTFPRDFEFVGNMASMARQIGNAVPVVLAEALGRHLARHLASTLKSNSPKDTVQKVA